jgi:crotonobetainyl-CoA:carnitine CoA-transferase CaiB-like acyl-CoA transferase
MIEDKALAERGMIVDVKHPQRGLFKTVGCPLVLSDSPVEVQPSPLLGNTRRRSSRGCWAMTKPHYITYTEGAI